MLRDRIEPTTIVWGVQLWCGGMAWPFLANISHGRWVNFPIHRFPLFSFFPFYHCLTTLFYFIFIITGMNSVRRTVHVVVGACSWCVSVVRVGGVSLRPSPQQQSNNLVVKKIKKLTSFWLDGHRDDHRILTSVGIAKKWSLDWERESVTDSLHLAAWVIVSIPMKKNNPPQGF